MFFYKTWFYNIFKKNNGRGKQFYSRELPLPTRTMIACHNMKYSIPDSLHVYLGEPSRDCFKSLKRSVLFVERPLNCKDLFSPCFEC